VIAIILAGALVAGAASTAQRDAPTTPFLYA
jgi:hypothetical protein